MLCRPNFGRPNFSRALAVVTAVASATIALAAAPAASESSASVSVARDISFPQCYGSLPREQGAAFGVLGTNNGMSFTRNPCLTRQLAWAKRLAGPPEFYANTGNPGPVRAKHWPLGQTSPKVCTSSVPNSGGCSYDYGWNAAWQSYSLAVDAAQQLHNVDRVNARRRAANVNWWLDVETMNSWQSHDDSGTPAGQARDVATLLGEIDALHEAGIVTVGIYSTSYQWGLITGGSKITQDRFAGVPQWLAGYESHADAVNGCGHRGPTGGPVRMTQYLGADGFDSNVVCIDPGSN